MRARAHARVQIHTNTHTAHVRAHTAHICTPTNTNTNTHTHNITHCTHKRAPHMHIHTHTHTYKRTTHTHGQGEQHSLVLLVSWVDHVLAEGLIAVVLGGQCGVNESTCTLRWLTSFTSTLYTVVFYRFAEPRAVHTYSDQEKRQGLGNLGLWNVRVWKVEGQGMALWTSVESTTWSKGSKDGRLVDQTMLCTTRLDHVHHIAIQLENPTPNANYV